MGKEVVESELRMKADSVISEMKKVTAATSAFSQQLKDVLDYLDKLDKKSLSNINKQINNTSHTINHNIHGQQVGSYYDMGSNRKFAKSSTGALMASDTGREKAFKDYEQAIIEETNAIRKDVEERTKRRGQLADAETAKAANNALKYAKQEDKTTVSYLEYRRTIAQAKLLNAQNGQAGALLRNPRYQFGRAAQRLGDRINGMGVGSDKIEGKLAGNFLSTVGAFLKSPWAGAATAIGKLTESVIDLSNAAVKAYAEIEATKTQLGVVFSNQTQADEMFGQISQYAVHSPFGIQQTSELAILLKQSGVYASDLMNTLRMLGDTAGGNMEKMKRIANNYAQIMAIGKASMLDMRQFAYAGIPIFEAVSKELNVSQQELRKLISDGKVTSDIIEKVFKNLTGINGIFENATEKGAKTLKARLQNLADAKQLAMSQVGQWGVNLGSKYGNDGAVLNLVTKVENIYQLLNDRLEQKNIQRDVENIENRDKEIEELEKLINRIEKAEAESDDEYLKPLLEGLKKEFSELVKRRNYDSDRAYYVKSYDNKTKGWIDAVASGETRTLDEIKKELEQQKEYKTYLKLNAPAYTVAEAKRLTEANEIQIQYLSRLVELAERFDTRTEKEEQKDAERNLLLGQQLEAEKANKAAGQTDSLNSTFQKLYELEASSDKAKREAEAKEMANLKKGQEILKQLLPSLSPKGEVDFTKLTKEEYLKYLNEGAFTNERSLTVTEGKGEQATADRKLLEKNIDKYIEEQKKDKDYRFVANSMKKEFDELKKVSDNEAFFREFAKFNAKYGGNEYFYGATNVKSARIGGQDVDLNKLSQNSIPIALWKRILASNTGLTALDMTDSVSTMEDYKTDMAVRNTAAGVLKATAKTMGAEVAMSLIKNSKKSAILEGTYTPTKQISWEDTEKEIQRFALSLSTTTDVIDAYKSGLEAEYETYLNVLAQGYTTAESENLKNRKVVSKKQIEKLFGGTQLVNAYEGELLTTEGKTVIYDTVKKAFVDNDGNKVEVKELVVTEKLYEWLQKALPEIKEEIAKAGIVGENNKALASILGNVKGTMLSTGLLQSQGISQATGFAALNSAYTTSLYDSNMASIKTKYESLKGMTEDDILIEAVKGNEEAKKAIQEVFEVIANGAKDLVNNPYYKELKKQKQFKDRNESVKDRVLKVFGHGENEDFTPDKRDGLRGLRNFAAKSMGYGKAYDREDFITQAALTLGSENYTAQELAAKKTFAEKFEKKRALRNGATESEANILADTAGQEAVLDMLDQAEQKSISMAESLKQAGEEIKTMASSMWDALDQAAQDAFLAPFEALGESLIKGDEAAEDLNANMAQIAANLLKNVGSAMATAGFNIAAGAALQQNWALVAGGLALAAAGGFASGLGGALSVKDDKSDKSTEDKTKKLESLRDDLLDLLKQAREDAVYYENTLRHKKALSTNEAISEVKVNDAIIAPNGNVITTAPDDYLIATKTPRTLLGGGAGSPTINFSVVDKSTGIQVTQQKSHYNEDTNTIEFEAVIESKVKEIIASSDSDEAFAAREARLRGRHVLM